MTAVVVAWFVVLVPMVLTRRDSALETVIRDNDTSSARVLQRKIDRRRRSHPMSARESSPSHELADDMVDTAVHERIVDRDPEYDAGVEYDEEPRELRDHGRRRTDSAREKMLQRRRRTLLGLGGFFLLTFLIAIFAGSWTWVIAAAAGVALAAFVVHLRNEARREEERRLTREVRANRARSDALGARETRSQSSLAANAFVASGVTEPDVVLLDDEDPELFDLADTPMADAETLGGRRTSEYQDTPDYYDWDDEDDDYGVHGATAQRPDDLRRAV